MSLTSLSLRMVAALVAAADLLRRPSRRFSADERGQASAEYALVLLGAAALALLVLGWATRTDLVGKLLDTVLRAITGKVS